VGEPQAFDIDSRLEAPLHGGEVAILRGSLSHKRDTLRFGRCHSSTS
jgi:hypothetical protein